MKALQHLGNEMEEMFGSVWVFGGLPKYIFTTLSPLTCIYRKVWLEKGSLGNQSICSNGRPSSYRYFWCSFTTIYLGDLQRLQLNRTLNHTAQ